MLTVISPAKTLDFETPPTTRGATRPQFLERSAELVGEARELSPDDLRELMGVSEKIAELEKQIAKPRASAKPAADESAPKDELVRVLGS